nr:RNA polymerase sigma factor [Brevundimonas sp.]
MVTGSEIYARAAGKDRAAFETLMTTTKGGLFRFVRRYTGDDEDALDLVQETYTAAWLAIHRYDPARSFDVWLRAIALNKCRDWGRRRTVRRWIRQTVGLDAPEATHVADRTPDTDALIDDRRRIERLNTALRDLPDNLKAPLLLTSIDGRSQQEAAQILGITAKAVETRIARARQKLASAMMCEG